MKLIYDFAFFRCHQFPHHSIFWQGLQLPICVRDIGITMGFLAGILALYLARNNRSRNLDLRTLLLFVPMAVDGGFQLLGFWESTFISRYLTGLLSGLGVALFFLPLLRKEVGEKVPSRKALAWFSLVSAPLFIGYFFMGAGYQLGIFGSFLFWLVVWSIPLIYFMLAMAVGVVGWRLFKNVEDSMEKPLDNPEALFNSN